MPAHVASDREADLHVVEVSEQCGERRGGEELEMGRVGLGVPTGGVPQTALQPKRVRHGADEAAARPEHALDVRDDGGRIGEVLEELAGDDDVEGVVGKRQLVLDVGPHGLDLEASLRLLECASIHVDADNRVPFRIVLRQGAGAAAEVEYAQAGATDELCEEAGALVRAEDELLAALMMLAIPLVEALTPGHRPAIYAWRAG